MQYLQNTCEIIEKSVPNPPEINQKSIKNPKKSVKKRKNAATISQQRPTRAQDALKNRPKAKKYEKLANLEPQRQKSFFLGGIREARSLLRKEL